MRSARRNAGAIAQRQKETEARVDRCLRLLDSDKRRTNYFNRNFRPLHPSYGHHTILTSQPWSETVVKNWWSRGNDYQCDPFEQNIVDELPTKWILQEEGISLLNSRGEIVAPLDGDRLKCKHIRPHDKEPWSKPITPYGKWSIFMKFASHRDLLAKASNHIFAANDPADSEPLPEGSPIEVYQETRFMLYIPPKFNKHSPTSTLELFLLRIMHVNYPASCPRPRVKIYFGTRNGWNFQCYNAGDGFQVQRSDFHI